jgi:alpha-D-ribose 1-methylphosphonate 5-triphosphate synthase subunit PhnG
MTDTLQELWIEARSELVEAWGNRLLNALGDVKVAIPPRPALVMMEARDSVERERFCVGELLVTECQIALGEALFWGRVLGDQPLRAMALALLAAAREHAPEAVQGLEVSFQKERTYLQRRRAKMAKAVNATKVRFETMTLT